MTILTAEQSIVIAVIFAAGLVLGLLLRSGGAKWRRKYEVERAQHEILRREHDAYIKRHNDIQPIEHDTLRAGSF